MRTPRSTLQRRSIPIRSSVHRCRPLRSPRRFQPRPRCVAGIYRDRAPLVRRDLIYAHLSELISHISYLEQLSRPCLCLVFYGSVRVVRHTHPLAQRHNGSAIRQAVDLDTLADLADTLHIDGPDLSMSAAHRTQNYRLAFGQASPTQEFLAGCRQNRTACSSALAGKMDCQRFPKATRKISQQTLGFRCGCRPFTVRESGL